jgi:hypothetical protein
MSRCFRRLRRLAALASLTCGMAALAPAPAAAQAPAAQTPAASPMAALLQGAERIGQGRVAAYRKGASTIVVLPPGALGKPLLWYTEAVALPAGSVSSNGIEVMNALARFERVGALVHVRDLSTVQRRRAGAAPGERGPEALPGAAPGDPKRRPVELAVARTQTGALIASFPVLAEDADGRLAIDITATFSSDIPAATGRTVAAGAGVVPLAVDPSKVVHRARARPRRRVLAVRSHLTFLGQIPALPVVGPQPVSVVLGHSIVFLPEKPMAMRRGRPAHRLLPVEFTQFETDSGLAQDKRADRRFRLEKKNPGGRRQRPGQAHHLLPGPRHSRALEAATSRPACCSGCRPSRRRASRNAIRVLDAPTPRGGPGLVRRGRDDQRHPLAAAGAGQRHGPACRPTRARARRCRPTSRSGPR